MKLRLILVSLVMLGLVGCGEEIHTVNDFKLDKELRTSFLKQCDNGELKSDNQNCLNAKKAKKEILLEADQALGDGRWKL